MGELPNEIGRIYGWGIIAVAGNPKGMMGKAIVEALVVEMLPRVNDGFLSVNFLKKSGEEVDTIRELL